MHITQKKTHYTLSLPDKSINLRYINVIELFHCLFDLWLVRPQVHHEYQSVVILNLLHGRLCCQGVSYDGVMVHLVTTWSRSARVFWLPCFLQSFWPIENHFSAYFLLNGSVSSLQNSLFGF